MGLKYLLTIQLAQYRCACLVVSTGLVLLGCAADPTTPVEGGTEPTAVDDTARTQTVSFQGPDFTLEGTLVLPTRDPGELVPGIVLIHGSGPNSRDEPVSGQLNLSFGFTLEVFGELAGAFSDEGYAVLRYDKRTCGTFNSRCANSYPTPNPSLVVDDFQADAAAAITYLRSRPEVDPARVVPVGHSQGSEFIAPLLSDDPSLPAGVMLAGPFRPIDTILQYQIDFTVILLSNIGSTLEQIEEAVGPLQMVADQLAELRAGTFTGSSIGGGSVAFWQSWMDLGDAREADFTGLSRPVLALSGDYDWNVPPSETEGFAALFEGLASDPGHAVEILPCVTHALNCITQPDWTMIGTGDIGRVIHPALVQAVVDFLR